MNKKINGKKRLTYAPKHQACGELSNDRNFLVLGFTLIELMVTMAIIAILAGVLLMSIMGYGKDARASKVQAQASSVIPSMISCAGNGGTPIFSGNICSVIPSAASYGAWPAFPSGYGVAASNWTSSSNWYFRVDGESQTICCNSKMNSCSKISVTCDQNATW